MRVIHLGFCATVAAFLLSGCATVVNGTHQEVAFSTIPEGSAVTVTGGSACTTPCKIKLARRNSVRVDLVHAGYKPTYVLMRSKGGAATVGNILAGGFIGVVIDSGNGSNNFLSPDPLKVRLAAEGSGEEAVLIDKGGKEQPVVAHNDAVRSDVAPTIGAEAAGVAPPPVPPPPPVPATAAATAPAAAPVPAPAAN